MKKIIKYFSITAVLLMGLISFNTASTLALDANQSSNTYYVDSVNGDDSNSGNSVDLPWKTLDKVNSVTFKPGDKILFKAGCAWEGQLWPKGSGNSKNYIIIDKYGEGNKPVINGNGTTYPAQASGAVMLYNEEYWEINNLEVTNYSDSVKSNRAGILAYTCDGIIKNHIYIKNCYVHDVNSDQDGYKVTGGIIVLGTDIDKDGKVTDKASGYNGVLIENNKVYNVSIEGIRNKTVIGKGTDKKNYPKVNKNIVIRNNYIEEVLGDGIVLGETASGGLVEYNVVKNYCNKNVGKRNYAGCWVFTSDNAIVQYNEVYGGKYGYNDGEAFDIDLWCDKTIIQYNYSHDNRGGFCLFMNGSTNSVFRYNISVNDGYDGNDIFYYGPTNSNEAPEIYNNTIYIGEGVKTKLFDCWNTNRYIKFYNNIVENHGELQYANYKFNGTLENNCIYNANVIDDKNAPAAHPGLIIENPKLVNPGVPQEGIKGYTDNYKISENSPCINKGRYIKNNGGLDFFGNELKDSKTDIGAHEVNGNIVKEDELIINSAGDAYVRDGVNANKNFGGASDLQVKSDFKDYSRISYIKFNLENLSEKNILSALFKVHISSVDKFPKGQIPSRTIKVYGVTDEWDESTVTWANHPKGRSYIADVEIKDEDDDKWCEIDITNYLKNNINSKEISFMLINEEEPKKERQKNLVNFSSKETINYCPQLVIK